MEILIKLSTDYVNKHVGLGLPGGYESSIASPQSAVAANELQQLRTLGEFTVSEMHNSTHRISATVNPST